MQDEPDLTAGAAELQANKMLSACVQAWGRSGSTRLASRPPAAGAPFPIAPPSRTLRHPPRCSFVPMSTRAISLRLALLACLIGCWRPIPAAAERPVLDAASVLVREAAGYGVKQWLRRRVYDKSDDARYGLNFQHRLEESDPDLPLVIQVHGYNSTYERNLGVMRPFQTAGYPYGGFSYPNDHSLSESAARMSSELKALARKHPDRQVVLVTHSMGGLVARACIEDGTLDPGNVEQLLMIAPPSQGTLIAHLAVATDLWEHWLGRRRGSAWARWRDSVVDGLGEAADDLIPGSPFLDELNGRARHPDVQYSIILGTSGALYEGEMKLIRKALKNTGGRVPGLRRVAGRLDYLMKDLDEVIKGKGDGIVAVKRGRLEGVDDVVLLPFDHLSVTGAPKSNAIRQVHKELLARVK